MIPLKINLPRLMARIEALGRVGARADGGVCRIALSDTDREARDLVVGWMRERPESFADGHAAREPSAGAVDSSTR